MTGWAITLIYVAGFFYYTRRFALSVIDSFDFGDGPDNGDRYMGLVIGAFAALFWPLGAPFYHARYLLAAGLRTPREIARAKDEELRHLRALAKQYDLPLLEVPPRNTL